MILVRPADNSDYNELVPLVHEIHRVHVEALPELFATPDQSFSRRTFARKLRSKYGEFLVAVDGDEVLGYAVVRLAPRSFIDRVAMRMTRQRAPWLVPLVLARILQESQLIGRGPRDAYIHEVVVSPRARRRGVGTTLTEACIGWSRAQGAAALELQVFEFNQSAIQLYRRLGFTTVTQRMRMPLAERAPAESRPSPEPRQQR